MSDGLDFSRAGTDLESFEFGESAIMVHQRSLRMKVEHNQRVGEEARWP